MRVAYLSVFPPYRGGISQFASALTKSFQDCHEIQAFSFKRQYPDFIFPGKTQYIEDQEAWNYPSKRTLDMLNPLTYWQTAQQIINYNPDLLIINYWMPFFAPALGSIAYLAKRKKIPTIAVLHNFIPHERRIGDLLLNRFFTASINQYLVMGNSVKNDLLALRPNSQVQQHPHPLYSHFGDMLEKESAQEKLSISKGKKVLLFFGLIRAYKGLDVLIEAFNLLSDEYVLLIAGEPYESYDRYQTLIDQNTNKERIHQHIRYVSDEEVPYFFSASDLCVLPYKSATQSGVVSISFHFELPVLVTDVGSLKEMVDTFQGGMACPPSNPTMLANQIQDFFQSSNDFPAQIRQQKEKYSWDSLRDHIIKLAI